MRRFTKEELAKYRDNLIKLEAKKAEMFLQQQHEDSIKLKIRGDLLRSYGSKIALSQKLLTESNINNLANVVSASDALKVLDLHQCALGNEGLNILLEPLKSNQSLETLNLTECGLTKSDTNAIASMLEQNTTLKKLNLSYNSLEDGAIRLFTALANNPNSGLLTLNLTRTDIRGDRAFGSDWSAIFKIYIERCLTVRVAVGPENYQRHFDQIRTDNINILERRAKQQAHDTFVGQSMALLQRTQLDKSSAVSRVSQRNLIRTLNYLNPNHSNQETKSQVSVEHKVQSSINQIRKKQHELYQAVRCGDTDKASQLVAEKVSLDVSMNKYGQTARGLMKSMRGSRGMFLAIDKTTQAPSEENIDALKEAKTPGNT